MEKSECVVELCTLCDDPVSKFDPTFQCDKKSCRIGHVMCNDCVVDQICPHCNAPVLERYDISIVSTVPGHKSWSAGPFLKQNYPKYRLCEENMGGSFRL